VQRAGAVGQVVGVVNEVAAVVVLLAVHAAVRALGILGQLVLQRLGVGLGLGNELHRRAVALAGGQCGAAVRHGDAGDAAEREGLSA